MAKGLSHAMRISSFQIPKSNWTQIMNTRKYASDAFKKKSLTKRYQSETCFPPLPSCLRCPSN